MDLGDFYVEQEHIYGLDSDIVEGPEEFTVESSDSNIDDLF